MIAYRCYNGSKLACSFRRVMSPYEHRLSQSMTSPNWSLWRGFRMPLIVFWWQLPHRSDEKWRDKEVDIAPSTHSPARWRLRTHVPNAGSSSMWDSVRTEASHQRTWRKYCVQWQLRRSSRPCVTLSVSPWRLRTLLAEENRSPRRCIRKKLVVYVVRCSRCSWRSSAVNP
jgi:hypothetical protein